MEKNDSVLKQDKLILDVTYGYDTESEFLNGLSMDPEHNECRRYPEQPVVHGHFNRLSASLDGRRQGQRWKTRCWSRIRNRFDTLCNIRTKLDGAVRNSPENVTSIDGGKRHHYHYRQQRPVQH